MNATEFDLEVGELDVTAGRPVVICEPELMFADVLRHLLEREGYGNVSIVTSLTDLSRAVEQAGGTPLCITELDGLGAAVVGSPEQLSEMRRIADRSLLVVLTGVRKPRVRARALATGIRAFLTKDQSADDVLAALRRVCEPNAPRSGVDPQLGFIAGLSSEPANGFLTLREQEVLQALVDGESTAGIAERLGVRPSTLRGYVQRVLMKLEVHSRAAAAAVAVQRGLVRPGGSRKHALETGLPVVEPGLAGSTLAGASALPSTVAAPPGAPH